MRVEYERDRRMVVWWVTEVECVSAVARRERAGETSGVEEALARLDALSENWDEVEPSVPLRRVARRLLRTHALRAADALQISAALSASAGDPSTLELLTLDDRLAAAARREGFQVVPQQQV
jgi:predicted nucleic acid-binding protein